MGAAAKATSEVVKAGSDNAKVTREVRKAEQMALVEAAKQTPGFQQAADIRGRKLAIKEQWGLAIMKPLSKVLGVQQDYFQTDFAKDFGVAIEDIPEENLQTPKAIIAGPVMEGLGYSLDEPELKALYLALLARASDDRVASSTHPSFVQIIRELTSEEARYLPRYLAATNQMTAIVRYHAEFQPKPGNGYRVVLSHVLDVRESNGLPIHDPMIPTYVDNWVRLKLVEVQYDAALTQSGAYDWASGRPEAAVAQEQIDSMKTPAFNALVAQRGITDVLLEHQRGLLTTTAFGHQFAEAAGMITDTL